MQLVIGGGSTLPAKLEITTSNPDETQALGKSLGQLARPGDIFLLTGPLGAGKTCLVQGLARGLDIEGLTPSPTFMLAREYRQGRLPLYHLDLYRLEFKEVAELGIDEYLYGGGIAAVEWAEKDPALMSEECLLIAITYADDEGARHLHLAPQGARYTDLLSDLASKLDKGNKTCI